jgi:nucleoside-diphosphate-sugar epimerase
MRENGESERAMAAQLEVVRLLKRKKTMKGRKIMKVLLTGAFGNFGTTTLHNLLEQGHEVRCFDLQTKANRKTAAKFGNRIETIWGDVRNPDDLALAVHDRDVVIHLAFIIDMLKSEDHPEWAREINVGGTKNLLDAIKGHSEPPKIIFASSISVFGHTQHLQPPRTLSDPVQPTSIYAHHKVECEELVRKSGLDWSILRIAFSPPEVSAKFDPVLFQLEPSSRLEFVHPRDVGLAVTNGVSSTEIWGKTLLVGGGSGCQLYYRDFIRQLIEGIGIRPLPEDAFALPPSSPLDWVDTTESQRILNYQKHSFEDYVREIPASMGSARYLVRLLGPLIRRSMLSQSPYLEQNK